MSKRLFNFCAGPAALPEAVLQRAQAELLDWQGKGLSIMEMSHRSDEFVSVAQQAEQDLREEQGQRAVEIQHRDFLGLIFHLGSLCLGRGNSVLSRPCSAATPAA